MDKINIKGYINKSINSLKSNKLFKPIFVSIISVLMLLMIISIIKKLTPVDNKNYQVKSESLICTIDSTNKALMEETYDVYFGSDKSNFEVVIPVGSDRNYDTIIKSIKCDGYSKIINRDADKISVIIKVKSKEGEDPNGYNRKINVSYVVDRGEDFDDTFDYFNYYLASPYRSYKLGKFDFIINFPKNIKSSISDSYKMFSMVGTYNEETIFQKTETRVSLINDGMSIQGSVTNGLDSYKGVKFNHSVYNKYFEGVRNYKNDSNKLIGLYIIFFFICFINFFLCGKDGTMLYQTSEDIPKQISPLLAGLFLADTKHKQEEANDYEFKHLSSLIIKWANEGYLTIEPFKVHISLEDEVAQNEKQLEALENGTAPEKTDDEYRVEYRFRKLKEAMRSSMPYFEKYIFDGLFVMSVNGCVDTNIIKNNMGPFKEYIAYFATQIDNAKNEVLSYANKVKDNFIDKRATRMKRDIKIISLLMWVVGASFSTLLHHYYTIKIVMPLLFISMIAILYFIIMSNNNLVNMIASFIVLFLGYYMLDINAISYILLSLNTILLIFMRKYSFEYELIIEKVKSFNSFLSKKKDRTGIVNALNDNPKFFYEALPYAITFKKLNVLINRTKEFNLAMPGWLIMQPEGYNIDVIAEIDSGINDTWFEIIDKNNESINNTNL